MKAIGKEWKSLKKSVCAVRGVRCIHEADTDSSEESVDDATETRTRRRRWCSGAARRRWCRRAGEESLQIAHIQQEDLLS